MWSTQTKRISSQHSSLTKERAGFISSPETPKHEFPSKCESISLFYYYTSFSIQYIINTILKLTASKPHWDRSLLTYASGAYISITVLTFKVRKYFVSWSSNLTLLSEIWAPHGGIFRITVSWNGMCALTELYQRFGEICCVYLQNKGAEEASKDGCTLKWWFCSVRLLGITSQTQ
jgi:hypothetical protein